MLNAVKVTLEYKDIYGVTQKIEGDSIAITKDLLEDAEPEVLYNIIGKKVTDKAFKLLNKSVA